MKYMPGDDVTILVDGMARLTFIDESGIQRFAVNGVVSHLISTSTIDMNKLFLAFQQEQFDAWDYQEFCMSTGYTVEAFNEMFGPGSTWESLGHPSVEIINPLWLMQKETVH